MLRRRKRERKEAGRPSDDDLPMDELLKELVGQLPAASPVSTPEDLQFEIPFGAERRAGQRRWGNPTEVDITSYLWPLRVHGIVINRSTGGIALLLDREIPTGTVIKVRSVEAPSSVPGIELEVRYCRKAGKNFLIGCEFSTMSPGTSASGSADSGTAAGGWRRASGGPARRIPLLLQGYSSRPGRTMATISIQELRMARTRRLSLEALEERCTPALSITIGTVATANVTIDDSVAGVRRFLPSGPGATLNVQQIRDTLLPGVGRDVVVSSTGGSGGAGGVTWDASADLDVDGITPGRTLTLATQGNNNGPITCDGDIFDSAGDNDRLAVLVQPGGQGEPITLTATWSAPSAAGCWARARTT